MNKIFCIGLIFFLFQSIPSFAKDEPIGRIKSVKGSVSIIRQKQILSANSGTILFQHDLLKTGNDGCYGDHFA